MRITDAEHVNRSRRQIVSLLASFAFAAAFFRFGTAHLQNQRNARD